MRSPGVCCFFGGVLVSCFLAVLALFGSPRISTHFSGGISLSVTVFFFFLCGGNARLFGCFYPWPPRSFSSLCFFFWRSDSWSFRGFQFSARCLLTTLVFRLTEQCCGWMIWMGVRVFARGSFCSAVICCDVTAPCSFFIFAIVLDFRCVSSEHCTASCSPFTLRVCNWLLERDFFFGVLSSCFPGFFVLLWVVCVANFRRLCGFFCVIVSYFDVFFLSFWV